MFPEKVPHIIMGISEIYYSWHNSHLSKNSVIVIKWTMKMNSCQELVSLSESSLWLRKCIWEKLESPVSCNEQFCLYISPSLWQIMSVTSMRNSRVTSTFLSSDSIAYYEQKWNRWRHSILPLPVHNVSQSVLEGL